MRNGNLSTVKLTSSGSLMSQPTPINRQYFKNNKIEKSPSDTEVWIFAQPNRLYNTLFLYLKLNKITEQDLLNKIFYFWNYSMAAVAEDSLGMAFSEDETIYSDVETLDGISGIECQQKSIKIWNTTETKWLTTINIEP